MFEGTAAALPRIDFDRIAEQADLPSIIEDSGVQLRHRKGFCPFHDNSNTPALSVFPTGDRWRFKCHGCGVKGDAITWVSLVEEISLVDAAKRLGGEDYHVGSVSPRERPERPADPVYWRDPEWQRVVDGLIAEAQDRLWDKRNAQSRAALDWLRSRGLADCTIERFRLGFVPVSFKTDPIEILIAPRCDGRIFVSRGITIPWVAPKAWYSPDEEEQPEGPRWVGCNVRRLADDVSAELPSGDKYLGFKGSQRGFLYPWPEILPTQGELPLLLVEGEFDALLGSQEVGHMLHVATAGSASSAASRVPIQTRSALVMTTWILLGFDHDKPGIKAAWIWRDRYPNRSRRVRLPFGKDLSEFFGQGGDLRGWVRDAINQLRETPEASDWDWEVAGWPFHAWKLWNDRVTELTPWGTSVAEIQEAKHRVYLEIKAEMSQPSGSPEL